MPTIKIDGRAVEVADGATVLAAARQIGIHIPTICFGGNGCAPSASCMVCAVKLTRTGQMVPSVRGAGRRRHGGRVADPPRSRRSAAPPWNCC